MLGAKESRAQVVPALVTPARVKRLSSIPGRSRRPSSLPSDDAEQLDSGTRIKRAAVENAPGRRVPPFPGTGLTRAVPPLPSLRPSRKPRPK
jgi:hypothetical protein